MTDSLNLPTLGSVAQDNNTVAAAARWYGAYPAIVTDNVDPDDQGRVKVTLPWSPDSAGHRFEQWARLATLMAGDNRGTWFIPGVGDEVLVVFQGGEPSYPIVIGSMWNGKDSPPDTIARSNDHKMLRTRGGIIITLDDSPGRETFTVEVPGERKLVVSNGSDSFLVKDDAGNSIHMTPQGMKITARTIEIDCSKATINAADLKINAPIATFSSLVKAETVEAISFIGSSYTNGAGNVW